MKKIIFVLLCVLSVFFTCCSKEKTINLNSEDSLSITPDQEWAVVKVPYAAFLEECDYSAKVKTHARSGDIFLVKGKEFIKKQEEGTASNQRKKNPVQFETWYRFEEGCLPSNLVEIYDTKLKAKSASEKFLKKEEK